VVTLVAKNGYEAIDYVKSNPDIKLVLMDLNMLGMDGVYATKLIKVLRPELPVIAQTAYTFKNVQNDFEVFGFSAFLSKPFGQEKLWETIRPFLNRPMDEQALND
jgi:CheY-like chemotaxis protein